MSSSVFFAKYSNFRHDPSAPLLEEFERLSLSRNWQIGSRRYREERRQCLIAEVDTQFSGSSTKLQGWQALLAELSIDPVPQTITQCRGALKGVYINLVDLLDARRTGSGSPRRFKSKQALRKYSRNSGKICPRTVAKEDGFIKDLLITMS